MYIHVHVHVLTSVELMEIVTLSERKLYPWPPQCVSGHSVATLCAVLVPRWRRG